MEKKERKRSKVVGINLRSSLHTVNLHKSWEEFGLTVIMPPPIRRKENPVSGL